MKYHCRFNGRKRGAIGIFYWISETVLCDDPGEIESILYRDYEWIMHLTITPMSNQ